MKTAMTIKLIITDIDGTLLDNRMRICRINKEAIAAAKEAGILVCIATGRAFHAVEKLVKDLDINSGLILCNGGIIQHGEKILARHLLQEQAVINSLQLAKECFVNEFIFSKNSIYMPTTGYDDADQELANSFSPCKEDCQVLRVLHDSTDIEGILNMGVEKLLLTSPDQVALSRARIRFESAAYYSELANCCITSSTHTNFEVMPRGVNKGAALLELAKYFGILPEEIMAVGNNENDVEMLRIAGLGVAVSNASPGAIAAANCITAPVNEGGLGKAIYKYALDYDPD